MLIVFAEVPLVERRQSEGRAKARWDLWSGVEDSHRSGREGADYSAWGGRWLRTEAERIGIYRNVSDRSGRYRA